MKTILTQFLFTPQLQSSSKSIVRRCCVVRLALSRLVLVPPCTCCTDRDNIFVTGGRVSSDQPSLKMCRTWGGAYWAQILGTSALQHAWPTTGPHVRHICFVPNMGGQGGSTPYVRHIWLCRTHGGSGGSPPHVRHSFCCAVLWPWYMHVLWP